LGGFFGFNVYESSKNVLKNNELLLPFLATFVDGHVANIAII